MKNNNNYLSIIKFVCIVYFVSSLMVTTGCGIPIGIVRSIVSPNQTIIVNQRGPDSQNQHFDPTINGKIAVKTIVQIRCVSNGSVGTGFLHKSSLLITAAHVVSGCPTQDIRIGSPGHDYGIKGLIYDMPDDIAALVLDRDDLNGMEVFTIDDNDELTYGEQISIWGFPEGYCGKEPLLTAGYISGLQDVPFYTEDGKVASREEWYINASVSGGMSGSPVVRVKGGGKIIGIISGKHQASTPDIERAIINLRSKHTKEDQELAQAFEAMRVHTQYNIGYVIPVSSIRRFLSQHGVEP